MLTQSNAWLFPQLNGAVIKAVQFEVPEKIDNILPLKTWGFEVFENSVGISIDPEPWWDTEEKFVAMLEWLFSDDNDSESEEDNNSSDYENVEEAPIKRLEFVQL